MNPLIIVEVSNTSPIVDVNVNTTSDIQIEAGKQGPQGPQGDQGIQGPQGVGVSDVEITDGHLQVTLDDATVIDAGRLFSATDLSVVTNAAGVNSLSYNNGVFTFVPTDVVTSLGFTPYNATNPAGYITSAGIAANISGTYAGSISSSQVTTALGFTPYNATNPAGYISGISGSDVTTALGYTPYNATNPTGYITSAGIAANISGTYAGSISSTQITTGLGFTPYDATNPTGYITSAGIAANISGTYTGSISSTQITTGLGFTPYDATNPTGYITSAGIAANISGTYAGSISSTQVTTALGFTPYNATNPAGYISSTSSLINGLYTAALDSNGNFTIPGNLTVSGSQTYIQGTNTIYTDNLIELHAPPGGVGGVWTSSEGKDVGIRMHYYRGGDKNAALVLAQDTGYLEWYSEGTETAGVFSGTYGTAKLAGILFAGDGTSQTTAWTGTVSDNVFTLQDNVDPTKQAQFQLSGLATGTTIAYTLPATATTLAGLSISNVWTSTNSFGSLNNSFGTYAGAATSTTGLSIGAQTGTKTVNIGTGGLSGSTTNIAIGSSVSGATSTTTMNGITNFLDTGFTLQDNTDTTKQARFELSGLLTGTTYVYTLPTSGSGASTLIDANSAQTISASKTFSGAANIFGSNANTSSVSLGTGATTTGNTKTVNIGTAGLSGSTTAITIGSNVAGATSTTTMNGITNFLDTGFTLQDDADPTKQAQFNLASITTATSRTYILPNLDTVLAGLAVSQTFSNTNVFSNGTNTFGSATVNSTIGLASGATTSGNTKTVNIGTSGLSGSTTTITVGATAGTSNSTFNGINLFSALGTVSAPTLAIGASNRGFYNPTGGDIGFVAGGYEQVRFLSASPTVNYLTMSGAATNLSPSVGVAGSDAGISLVFQSKGSGGFGFYTASGSVAQVGISHTASAVNYLSFTGSATNAVVTTNAPTISSQGSDATIGLNITSKSFGVVNINTGTGTVAKFQDRGVTTVDSPFIFKAGLVGTQAGVLTLPVNAYVQIPDPTSISFVTNAGTTGGQGTFVQTVISHTANAVNYVNLTGAGAGGPPTISVGGSDANIALTILSKGTSDVNVGGTSTMPSLKVSTVTGQVNSFQIYGQLSGQSPTLATVGQDANIGIGIAAKGTGSVNFSGNGQPLFNLANISGSDFTNYYTQTGQLNYTAAGGSTNINFYFGTKGTGSIQFATGGGTQVVVSDTTSAVNRLNLTGGQTGQTPKITSSTSGIPVSIQGSHTWANFNNVSAAIGVSTDITNVVGAHVVLGSLNGNAPYIGATNYSTSSNGGLSIQTNGTRQFLVSHTASAVNYIAATGSQTGSYPTLSAQGSDGNTGLTFSSQGTGPLLFSTAYVPQMYVTSTASAVNYVNITGSATNAVVTANAPTISAAGSDANINLKLVPKGTGYVYLGNVVNIGADYSVAGILNLAGNTNVVSGTGVQGVYSSMFIDSTKTGGANMFSTYPSTQATAFTIATLVHYKAALNSIGAGSAITNQYGFIADNSLIGATNNYGFYSNIAAATGRYNFYANGTALNVFVGNTTLGGAVGNQSLQVNNVSNAVNYAQIVGAISGGGVVYSAQGNDPNIYTFYDTKGVEAHGFRTNGGQQQQFRISHTGGAVNYLQVTGAGTNASPTISAGGSDANIGLVLTSKGTGVVTVSSDAVINGITAGIGGGAQAQNTVFGYVALPFNSTGNFNVAIGYQSMFYNKIGSSNVGLGYRTLFLNTTAGSQLAMGQSALSNVTTNVATFGAITAGSGYTNGTYTAVAMTPVSGATFVTYPTVTVVVSGGVVSTVTLVTAGEGASSSAATVLTVAAALIGGTGSGFSIPVGSFAAGANNTAIGSSAGSALTTGSNNTIIGYQAAASTTTVSNEVTLGNGSITAFRIPGLSITAAASALTIGTQFAVTNTGSAVNYIQVTGSGTNGGVTANAAPSISALGSDTNINLVLSPKGTGSVVAGGNGTFSGAGMLTGSGASPHYIYSASATSLGFRVGTTPSYFQFTDNAGSIGLTTGNPFFFTGSGGYTFKINNSVASSVNYLSTFGNTTGKTPMLFGDGSDANVGLSLSAKGTGNINLVTAGGSVNIVSSTFVSGAMRTNGGGNYTSVITGTVSAPTGQGGTTATVTCGVGAQTIGIQAAGTGYAVNDVVLVTGGTGVQAQSLLVTSVAAGTGAITGVSVYIYGFYTTALPTNPVSVTNTIGTGSGATFNLSNWSLTYITVVDGGSGYLEQPTLTFSGAGGSAAAGYLYLGSAPTIKSLASSMSFNTPGGTQLVVSDSNGTSTDYVFIAGSPYSRPVIVAKSIAGANANLGISATGPAAVLYLMTNNTAQIQAQVNHTASAVNYLALTGAATNGAPMLSSAGSDASVNLQISAKNQGYAYISNGNGISARFFGGVNYLNIAGSSSGYTSIISTTGQDSNIPLGLVSKGTGGINLSPGSSGVNISNGTSLTGSIQIGQTGGFPGTGYSGFPTVTISAPTTPGGVQAVAGAIGAMKVTVAAVVSGGSGYLNGEVLTVVGGTTVTAAATLTITGVSGNVITAVSSTNFGAYSVLPTNPVSVTGGSGSGATFTLGYGIYSGTVSITTAGSGYIEQPTITFTGAGTPTTAAVGYATVGSGTIVRSVGTTMSMYTPGGEQFRVTDSAYNTSGTGGTANYVGVTGGPAGSAPIISTGGTDANIGLVLTGKGTGAVVLGGSATSRSVQIEPAAGGTTSYTQFKKFVAVNEQQIIAANTANLGLVATGGGGIYFRTADTSGLQAVISNSFSPVNYLNLTGAATGTAPVLSVLGSDTNISLAVQSKGTGAIDLATGSNGVNISNGTSVTSVVISVPAIGAYATLPTMTFSAPTTTGGVTATVSPIMTAWSYVPAAGGTGYAVNDVLTIVGGTFTNQVIQLKVTAVSGSSISSVSVNQYGNYSALPTNPVSVTNVIGSGSGATITMLWSLTGTTGLVGGSGYIEQPTITISGTGGAAAYAVVGSQPVIKSIGSSMVFNTAGGSQLRINDTTSTSVNYWNLFGAATGKTPTLGVDGSDTNIPYALTTKGSSSALFYTNGFNSLQAVVNHTASVVNYLTFTGSVAQGAPLYGVGPVVSVAGSDTNINLNLTGKGTGGVAIQGYGATVLNVGGSGTGIGNFFNIYPTTNFMNFTLAGTDANIGYALTTKGPGSFLMATGGGVQAAVINTASAVNYLNFTGAATGASPIVSAVGSDVNVPLTVQSKNAGSVNLAAGSSGVNISNGTTVTAITRISVGAGYTSFPTLSLSAPTGSGGAQAVAGAIAFMNIGGGTVASGGTSGTYAVGEVLNIVGGTPSSTIGTLTIGTVSGGLVTSISATNFAAYTVLPANPISVTGGGGTGATFNVYWSIGVGSVTVTTAGSGYIEQPVVTIVGGGTPTVPAVFTASVGSATVLRSLNNTFSLHTPSGEQFRVIDSGPVSPVGSIVNYVGVTGSATGNAPYIGSYGSDANLTLGLQGKGTLNYYGVQFNNPNGFVNLQVFNQASSVNYFRINPAVTGMPPIMAAYGSDTNIGIALRSQGSGAINLASGTAGINISNYNTVTTLVKTNAGTGYTSPPSVAISAPTTQGGITATASVNCGPITVGVVAGGTGYAVNDVLIVSGGTSTVAYRMNVTAVSGSSISVVNANTYGQYTVFPANPVSVTNAVGTGSGATFNLTWGINTPTVLTPGSGYIEQPSVTFSGGGGNSAAAYAQIGTQATIRGLGGVLSFNTPGGEQLRIIDPSGFQASSVNFISLSGAPAGNTPTIGSAGADANVALSLYSKGTSPILFVTSGASALQAQILHTASAVNYLTFTGAVTAGPPVIQSQGSDADINLFLKGKGTGSVLLGSAGGQGGSSLYVSPITSSVNYVRITGAIANNSPQIIALGQDANINLTLSATGTGFIRATSQVMVGRNYTGNDSIGIGGSTNFAVATGASGIYNDINIDSTKTVAYTAFNTYISTATAAFNVNAIAHYKASFYTLGAGSSITNHYGFFADGSLGNATNTYGFYSGIVSGANRYNFYAAGTAANVFVGDTTLGGTIGTQSLQVNNVSSAVNYVQAVGSVTNGGVLTAAAPELSARGSDTNINLKLTPKGTGIVTVSNGLTVNGAVNALTKSFVIPHPTKPNMILKHGSLEGPEFGVYVRGKTTSKVIELPDYWTGLVDEDTITVDLTPIGKHQKLYVEKIEGNRVYINVDGVFSSSINCFYTVWGERKDVGKLDIEVAAQ